MNLLLLQYLALPIGALAAAAGILTLLHVLRVQPPRRMVATILFWHAAAQEEHRRVLWERFSRWRTFLFLLFIVALLSTALTGMRWAEARRCEPIAVVVDAGFSMASSNAQGRMRLSEAVDLATKDLTSLGNRPIAVVTAGTRPELLVRLDQPHALAAPAISTIQANPAPSASADALQLATQLLPADRGRVLWYTDRARLPDELPEVICKRITMRQVGATSANAAILSATFEPSDPASQTGRLRVRVGAFGAQQSPAVVSLKCDAQKRREQSKASTDGSSDVVFEDLIADGSECHLQLSNGGAATADDTATVRLPNRPGFTFRIKGEIPQELRTALTAIAGKSTDQSHTIEVTGDAQIASADPLILISSSGQPLSAGTTVQLAASPLGIGLHLESAVCGSGSDLKDLGSGFTPLIRSGDSVLAAIGQHPPRLLLSDTLFSQESNLPSRPAMFVLLTRACQQLAGWSASPVSISLQRKIEDPLWAATTGSNTAVTTFTGDRQASNLAVAAIPLPTLETSGGGFGIEPWQFILATALLLLLIESMLHIRRRIV